ncbi:hypothetical protein V493_06157 [Pseudogymnoascus sp. VKM F-4281 (FW-2241)]|nr:hypothetical protein V493_06157 [Pseudogymnoascus sp. VKM F-4281 (FW-2241)]
MISQKRRSLTSSIASQSDLSLAARALLAPTEEKLSTGNFEGGLWHVWGSIVDVAADTEHQSQEPLVAMVTVWDEKVKLWSDLPVFGPTIREAWNLGFNTDYSASQWHNLNAFIARLTSLSPSTPEFDFSLFGLWTLKSAFEGTNEGSPADADAAKLWFMYAEDVLTNMSNEGKSFPNKLGAGGTNFADKDWTGFNTERIEVWKSALDSL